MANAVRIRATDPELAGSALEILHPERLTPQGPKLYRIALDDQATALVSVVVWERLQHLMNVVPGMPRFIVDGSVRQPPTQLVNGAGAPLTVPGHRVLGGALVPVGPTPIPRLGK
jgi:hypothetical protein